VVGYGGGSTGTDGFISARNGGPLRSLPLLPGTNSGVATGINESGKVTGYDYDANAIAHPYISAPDGGALNELGTVGGLPTYATSINNRGEITGVAWLGVIGNFVPFTAFIGSVSGGLTVIRSNMYGASINDGGDVVGWNADGTRALIYKRSGLSFDLNNAVTGPLAQFVTLTDARAINNDGAIAANGIDSRDNTGTFNPDTHAYLLTPVPIPDELAALLKEVTSAAPGTGVATDLAMAEAYYAVDDLQSTCAVLTSVVNDVLALNGTTIGQALDPQLIADAQAIETAIGCRQLL
jgi:hypothetical protein